MFILSGLIGALIGALASIGFQVWKFARDEINSRNDELCKTVFEAATAASEYWSDDFDMKKSRLQEAKIFGMQSFIDTLWTSAQNSFRHEDIRAIDECLADLGDALPGGQFTVSGRKADYDRMRAAPYLASEVVVLIRNAHRNTIPLAKERRNLRSE